MHIPQSLASLSDLGIIEEVLRPLMSGKEAEVYLVLSGGERRVAKVYKEAQNRSFKHRAAYTEGRAVRNSRDQRAMGKHSRYGKSQDEAAWRSTEVDMIYRLRSAGVRVPTPHHFIDGVLVMELITDAEGNPAPRLGEVALERADAVAVFDRLIVEVVRMLCAGVVHGDLSDFNVLLGADGPVVIDFPQSVDASSNTNARRLLIRDVDNLQDFLGRCAPDVRPRPLGQEMWDLYKLNQLTPDTRLTGRYLPAERAADTREVISLIGDADRDERRRREALGLSMRGTSAPRRTGSGPGSVAAPPTTMPRRVGSGPGSIAMPSPNPQRRTGSGPGSVATPSNGPRGPERPGFQGGNRDGGQGRGGPHAPQQQQQRGGPHAPRGGPPPQHGGPQHGPPQHGPPNRGPQHGGAPPHHGHGPHPNAGHPQRNHGGGGPGGPPPNAPSQRGGPPPNGPPWRGGPPPQGQGQPRGPQPQNSGFSRGGPPPGGPPPPRTGPPAPGTGHPQGGPPPHNAPAPRPPQGGPPRHPRRRSGS